MGLMRKGEFVILCCEVETLAHLPRPLRVTAEDRKGCGLTSEHQGSALPLSSQRKSH